MRKSIYVTAVLLAIVITLSIYAFSFKSDEFISPHPFTSAAISTDFIILYNQFYPNLRYQESNISYFIDPSCSSSLRDNIIDAFSIISNKTILNFFEMNYSTDMVINCTNITKQPNNETLFVAGEGGPKKIINATNFAVIMQGEIFIYRPEKCSRPQIALHEIIHALGFEHNNNSISIMYPVVNCNQDFDEYIINELNDLYNITSAPDLSLDKIEGNKTFLYFTFSAHISNVGLKNATNISLIIYNKDEKIKEFFIGNLSIGSQNTIYVQNLRIPLFTKEFTFKVISDKNEITLENNKIVYS